MVKQKENSESRPFGLASAVCLVIANMIGAGIFTTSGFSLGDLGSRQTVMWAWAIGGVIAICGAVSYGRLSQQLTESGGEYLFLSRKIHPAVGFVAGWVSMLAGFSGAIAFAALTFEAYFLGLFERPDVVPAGVTAIFLVMLFGVLHMLQMRLGIVAQNITIAIKYLLLVSIIAFAFWSYPAEWKGLHDQIETRPFDFAVFAGALVWISMSFSGYNCAIYIAGEIKNPKQNVFRAMVIGTIAVTTIYLLLNFVFLFAPASGAVSGQQQIATIAAGALGGKSFAVFVTICILIALVSSVSSMIIAGPRVYAQMAKDGVLPAFFRSSEIGRDIVPVNSITLQVALSVFFIAFSDIRSLLDYLGLTLSLSAATTVACLFISSSAYSTSKKMLWLLPAFFFVSVTLLLGTIRSISNPLLFAGFAFTVVSGLVLYYVQQFFGSNSKNKKVTQ